MAEILCVNGCGRKARRNPDSKGQCLDCSLEAGSKSTKGKPTVEEVCACGTRSTDPGAPKFKDGKCKTCRDKEAQRRFQEKKRAMKNEGKNKTPFGSRG